MECTLDDLKEAVVSSPAADQLIEVLSIGVGDKDLPEVTPADEMNNPCDTLGIELVEDVVQQE